MTEQVTVRREVSNFYAVLGGVVSAGSLISLVQKVFSVGLVPVLAEFVAYYRKITHFFVDWVFFWMPLQLPDWYRDAYIISFVLAVLIGQARFRIEGARASELPPFLMGIVEKTAVVIVAAIISIPLLGIAFVLVAPRNMTDDPKKVQQRATYVLFFKMIFAMVIATVAFFALNSQL